MDFLTVPNYITRILLRHYWLNWDRLENYICILSSHPEYLECFMKLEAHLFHGDLPIPYPDRYCLAIMAAAEQRCLYLVLLYAQRFLATGGDPVWLKGFAHMPAQWTSIAKLNQLLCHQPWLLNSDLIAFLTRSQSSGQVIMSLSQLMHATVILSRVHALATLVHALSLAPELDHFGGLFGGGDSSIQPNNSPPPKSNNNFIRVTSPTKIGRENNNTTTIVETFREKSVNSCPCSTTLHRLLSPTELGQEVIGVDSDDQRRGGENGDCQASPASQLRRRLENELSNLEPVSLDLVNQHFASYIRDNATKGESALPTELVETPTDQSSPSTPLHPMIARFLPDPDGSVYSSYLGQHFSNSDYSWSEQGCPLTDLLCHRLGTMLDDVHRAAHDLTYNTLNTLTDVDTSVYRWSVWNHIQSLYGIIHEEFRYDCVDQLLPDNQRALIRLIATQPWSLSGRYSFDPVSYFPALTASEVVHLLITAMEARHQSCMVYLLYAISAFQAPRS